MSITHPQVFDHSAGKFRELRTSDLGGNIPGKFRDGFEGFDPIDGDRWRQPSTGMGDVAFADGNAAAASYLVVSKSPWLQAQETVIELHSSRYFRMPAEVVVALSMSQRTLGQEFAFEVVDTAAPLPDVPLLDIVLISQSGSTLTIGTRQPHGLSVGKSIGVRDVADSRVNYPALVVSAVPAPNQFQCTAGPGGTIPSLTSVTIAALAATTAGSLPSATYANGTAGVGATLTANVNGALPAQDGVTVTLGGRLFVKNQGAGAENGLYVLTQQGDAGTPWVLTRAPELDTAAELTVVANARAAVSVWVEQGTASGGRQFVLDASVTTVGTTAVSFSMLTWPRANLGRVYFRERLGRANNGVSWLFENASATNASLYIRSESGDALPSGTIAGNHSVTVRSTNSAQLVNSPGQFALTATHQYSTLVQSDRVQWVDTPVDSVAQPLPVLTRTQVCPDPDEIYKVRIRGTNYPSLTAPLAEIVRAEKTGTVNATITLDRDIEFEQGDLFVVYGIRDQGAAAFPNVTAATPVLAAIDSRNFTIPIGTAASVISGGGYVARVQGGNLMSVLGAVAQTVQSATLSTLVDGTRQLVLVGSANWATPATTIGDLLELIGCRIDTTGGSLGVDGPWKVFAAANNILTLWLPTPGQRTLPADFATTTCGGGLIRRTDLRASFVRIFDYERLRVEALARPAGDAAGGMPVSVQGGSVAVSSLPALPAGGNTIGTILAAGQFAEDAAASVNPVVTGGVVRTARAPTTLGAGDAARHTMTTEASMTVQPGPAVPLIEVASAARTSSGNSGLISVAAGGGLSGLIAVTAASGTTPTLDITLEESYDNGTTWSPVWTAQRITGVSTVVIPPMLTAGLRRWAWVVGGTSPSFTFAITANAVPSPCPILRQSFDRTAALLNGTLSAASAAVPIAGCKAVTAKVSLGAAGTPATYQIQVSDDNASWVGVGTATAGIANQTVAIVMPAGITANFARVACTVAGATQTGNYVAINAVA